MRCVRVLDRPAGGLSLCVHFWRRIGRSERGKGVAYEFLGDHASHADSDDV